jgi:hypothetical protein
MKKFLGVIFLMFFSQVQSQESWFSGGFYSNMNYYLNDNKTGDFDEEHRFRSNNYLNLDGNWSNFEVALQLEGYAPSALLNYPNVYDQELGISAIYATYNFNSGSITVGNIYEEFGNGLVFRTYEDRDLGINNSLFGGRATYNFNDKLNLKAVYGKQKAGFDLSDGSIFGLDAEWYVSKFNLGFSYVNRFQKMPSTNDFNEYTNAFSGRVNFNSGNFSADLEYAYKSEDALVEFGFVNTEKLFDGNALLLELGYAERGFGINGTFRRLENMNFYSDREMDSNIDNQQWVNYLPSLTKQHDYALSNIYIYQAQTRLSFAPYQKAGEIGSQIDAFYTFKKGSTLGGKHGTKLALNYSVWHGLDADFDSTNKSYTSEFLGFGEKYFSEFALELRKKISKQWMGILSFNDLYYNRQFIEETSGEIDAQVLNAEGIFKFGKGKSLRFVAEHLWSADDTGNWYGGTLEFNPSSKWNFFMTDIYNYENILKKVHYFNVGMSYRRNQTSLRLNYGRQRGGLICVGGVCRVVPEASGFGLSLSTVF